MSDTEIHCRTARRILNTVHCVYCTEKDSTQIIVEAVGVGVVVIIFLVSIFAVRFYR